MKLNQAKKLANELIHKHELNWKFKFDNAVGRFGRCNYKKKEISLSRNLVKLNKEEDVKDTILHEIAHALMDSGNGHNYFWKRKAKEIGCNTGRCYDNNIITPPKKFIGTCPICDRTILRNKRNIISCGKCSTKFNPEYLFKWKLNK